ncbi:MAG: PepSY domain-containing protein, partial [Pseudomonadales bacterium]|nr:PepSY domain-containing protein [Pseudomonadales bacterium]
MHKFLTTLHRWLGFPLGIFFVVTFGTGAITAVDELLKHIQLSPVVDDVAYESMPVTNQADALQAITAGKDFIRAVSLPSAEFPYFELQQRIPKTDNNPPQNLTHRYRFDTYTEIQVIEEEKSPFFDTVLQLHRNFLLGKEGLWGIHGKYFVAWLGLIALLISLIGLWLWWPLRKSFKARHLVPGNTARKTLYFNHLSAGVVCLALIVMLAITGASISYRDVTQSILGVSKHSAPSPAIQVGE